MRSRRLFALAAATALVACLGSLPQASRAVAEAAPSARQDNSPTIYIPDDDSVAAELTYHWQNPRYSEDERRQIGYIVVILAAVGMAGAARRLVAANRRRPRPSTVTEGNLL